jgi:HSP20 family protein
MLPNWSVRSPLVQLLDVDLLNDLSNNGLPALKSAFSMKVDVLENEKEFVVHSDLPGVNKEDIKVDFKDRVLTIAVEAKMQKEEKEGEKVWRRERSFSKKSRSFHFDVPLDEASITAKYENGVLTLNLPKKLAEERNTSIQIL